MQELSDRLRRRIEMANVQRFLKLWFPPILYAVSIFWLSSLERPFGIELEFGNMDKLIHLLEYSVFGFLLIRAIHGLDVNISTNIAILITFTIGTFYGFTDELHQSVVPGRFATVSDFIFDSIGTFVGAAVFSMRGYFSNRGHFTHINKGKTSEVSPPRKTSKVSPPRKMSEVSPSEKNNGKDSTL